MAARRASPSSLADLVDGDDAARDAADRAADARAGQQDDYPEEGTYDYFDGRSGIIYRGLPAAPTAYSYRLVNEDSEADAALEAGELPLHGHADLSPEALGRLQQLQYEQPGRLFGRDHGGAMQELEDMGPDQVPRLYDFEADPMSSVDRAGNTLLQRDVIRGGDPDAAGATMDRYMMQRTKHGPVGPSSAAPALPSIADAFEAGYSGKPIESIAAAAGGETATDAPAGGAAPGQQTAQLGPALRAAGGVVARGAKAVGSELAEGGADFAARMNTNPVASGAMGEAMRHSGVAGSVEDMLPAAAEVGAGMAAVGDPLQHGGSNNEDVQLYRMLKPHLPEISPEGIQALRDAYPGATIEQIAKAALVHARTGVPLGKYKPPADDKSKSDELRSSGGRRSATGERDREMAQEPPGASVERGEKVRVETAPAAPAPAASPDTTPFQSPTADPTMDPGNGRLIPLQDAIRGMRGRQPGPGAMSEPASVADAEGPTSGLIPLHQALPMLGANG